MALTVQGTPDSPDAAVHHVRRRDNVSTSLSLGYGLLAQVLNRLVVQDDTAIADDAVMAIAIIRVQCHVSVHLWPGKGVYSR